MEKLVNITPEDISNGVLNQLLADAGIPDVQQYVQKFHQETEDNIINELKNSDPDMLEKDEEIVTPVDIHHWLTELRPRLEKSIDEVAAEQPSSVSLGPPPPIDLNSWMKGMIPDNLIVPPENPVPQQTDQEEGMHGNLGTWLTDWSRSLGEQPPPTSLDTWLKGLISTNIHEPIGKAKNPKGRLNSYLNAAEKVLSKHGYDVSNEIKPSEGTPVKAGMFGNVKQMYFLWKMLDKNNDRKITVDDVQILLQEMGLGFLSKYAAQSIFNMVDSNHDGSLQFRDFIAFMSIIKQLIGAMSSVKA